MINKRLKETFCVIGLIMFLGSLFLACNMFPISNKLKTITNYKFGMIIGEDKLGDKAFNDSANDGLEKIKDNFKSKITIETPKTSGDYKNSLEKLAKDNDLTFAVGFKMKEALDSIAKISNDKNFVLIDETSLLPNVKSVLFKDEEGAYLMGLIAGKMTKTNRIGFIGGVENVLIQKFEAGFSAGVKSVNANAAETLENGSYVKYVANFSDNEKSYNLAKSLYDNGVDIIFHAAGGAGVGVFKAAKESGNFAIGVDKDQAIEFPEYSDVILSSMVKSVDVAVFNCAKEFMEGNLAMGTDNKLVIGLKENGISVAKSTENKVSKEILDLISNYNFAIRQGNLVIPTTPDGVKSFNAVLQ